MPNPKPFEPEYNRFHGRKNKKVRAEKRPSNFSPAFTNTLNITKRSKSAIDHKPISRIIFSNRKVKLFDSKLAISDKVR